MVQMNRGFAFLLAVYKIQERHQIGMGNLPSSGKSPKSTEQFATVLLAFGE